MSIWVGRVRSRLALLAVCGLFLVGCTAWAAEFKRPNGVAIAPDGSLYVMDLGHYRVAHVSQGGGLLDTFGSLGTGPAQIYSGWDIALDGALNVYICNHVRDESGYIVHDGVKVFTPDGHFLRELGGQDYPAGTQMPVNRVYGLDIDDASRVYVADYGTNSVRVFDRQGRQLARFFGQSGLADGEFNGLNDVAVDNQRGYLYAIDNVNNRVQQFELTVAGADSLTATHRLTFGGYGHGVGEFAYPQYIAVDDRTGRIYVGDMANRRIQVFDVEGKYLAEFAPPGIGDWQVMGLTVAEDGSVYAADTLNNCIWVFGADGGLRRRIGGG
jgi:tripartite motif-containing protein 71